MDWLVFSATLSSKNSSSPRVTLWRRLRRLGAVSPTSGVYILPARDECLEAFQWLAQEIRQAQGEALLMHVDRFEGLADPDLIALFNAARAEDYRELDPQLVEVESGLARRSGSNGEPVPSDERGPGQDRLERLRRRYADIARVDYFQCPEGAQVGARLAAISRALAQKAAPAVVPAPASLADFRSARWVTRPRPHVDRLSCAWLIRRFINPHALIRYSAEPEPGEVAFDMENARFGHQGSLCSFETMQQAFGLDDPALQVMGEVVHEIDLRDGLYRRPETPGVEAILDGWQQAELADADREARGIALFEGLYGALLERLQAASTHRLPPEG